MKNFKNTIIVSLVATVVFASLVSYAAAQTAPKLYVSPSTATKAAGQTFSASITMTTNPTDIVYAVEGTIGFDNLTCKGISAVSGIMIQSMPTCANPYFLVGIPNGTNADKKLFTVSVAGKTEGQGAIVLSSVDLIGNGISLGTQGVNGIYTISGVFVPEKEASTTAPVVEGGEVVPSEEGVVETPTEETEEATATTTASKDGSTGLLAAAGDALYGIPSALVIVVGALLIALFIGLLYYRRTKPEEQI